MIAEKQKRQCGADTKDGTPCERPPMNNGSGRCHRHGGKSLAGAASPRFKHGRYSKVMPTQLMERYEQARGDPDLLGIREDIILQDTLLHGALDAMSRGEAGELWVRLKETWKEYQRAKNGKKKEGDTSEGEALHMIGFLISEGYQDYMARIELRQMLQERAKLVDAEGKRLERANQMLTTTQAMSYGAALLQAVLAHVSDRNTLTAIEREFSRIIGVDDKARLTTGRTAG